MGEQYDFGLVGLGVMGRNFILNVAENNFSAFGLDNDKEKVAELESEGSELKVGGTTDPKVFIQNLAQPRKIMLLVPAGGAVDAVINTLLPELSEGDIIIDGGNSFFEDTDRREAELKTHGIHFFGAGVSGGAEGARKGPSIMPGGDKIAYQVIEPIFQAVSAKVGNDPCVAYMGERSAGNYVKMVHNGIEYGMMQLIAESYDVLKNGLGQPNNQLAEIYGNWNEGKLQSFLVEITSQIFPKQDELTSNSLVDLILDKAKQKGTGKWTSQNAMDLGNPIPTIDGAVSMRGLSSMKELRKMTSSLYPNVNPKMDITIEDVESCLLFCFIITYAQGLTQLSRASMEYDYGLNLEVTCKIWRGGCIIRSGLLEDFRKAYERNSGLESILLDKSISDTIRELIPATRKVISSCVENGIPAMCFSSCLSYFDSITAERLPLNLVQAQRDFFGSHTYERIDMEGIFHTEW